MLDAVCANPECLTELEIEEEDFQEGIECPECAAEMLPTLDAEGKVILTLIEDDDDEEEFGDDDEDDFEDEEDED